MDLTISIAVDDPRAADVHALLAQHLAFAYEVTPPGHVHALEVDAVVDSSVTFFAARDRSAGTLLGVGALKQLDASHAELKSMHVAGDARGRGVGRALVRHLLAVARDRGCARVSLETGTMDAFAAARRLYASEGFVPCEPFGAYTANPNSVCMTIE